ncbi:YARHG domain-containing protein [Flammeovirga sp. SR4]|uniref:YARHG domain-containing protein n=2 Tax=Flammeovirga agarivorans TaxID=2726742 RepID=A0A7X8XZE9_9BACT|nr:YARHG domain-containing protein [Flammeovirga agarivorans]
MKTKLLIFSLTFIFISKMVSGQVIGFEQIENSKVTPWNPKLIIEYQYVYHFGESEAESDLIITFGLDKEYAQIKSGKWSENGQRWISHYENLTNVRINGNKFYSDQTNGQFVIYNNGQEKIKGLKVYKSWSGLTENDEYEIGIKSYSIDDYFNGEFTQASKRLLSRNELLKIPKSDLKIMRNEIFARYGYKFKSGGKMERYFKSQDWYSGEHDNVNDFLTELEKENILLIKQVEKI